MASIAIMIGGAILNATTFVGGSYLAKYMSGDDLGAERKRHDLPWKNMREIIKLGRNQGNELWIGILKDEMNKTLPRKT